MDGFRCGVGGVGVCGLVGCAVRGGGDVKVDEGGGRIRIYLGTYVSGFARPGPRIAGIT